MFMIYLKNKYSRVLLILPVVQHDFSSGQGIPGVSHKQIELNNNWISHYYFTTPPSPFFQQIAKLKVDADDQIPLLVVTMYNAMYILHEGTLLSRANN